MRELQIADWKDCRLRNADLLSGSAGIFSGKEGDPVPAQLTSLNPRGQGPLPDLTLGRLGFHESWICGVYMNMEPIKIGNRQSAIGNRQCFKSEI
jgi:hypothetical protein